MLIVRFCAYVVALNSTSSPKCTKGILQASGLLYRVHRNLTSPPSLWPSRELRKYHYSLCLSSPPPEAIRFSLYKFYRSLPKGEVMAHLQSRIKVSLNTSNVPEECIFNFQGSRRICFSSHYPTDKKTEKFNPLCKKIEKYRK